MWVCPYGTDERAAATLLTRKGHGWRRDLRSLFLWNWLPPDRPKVGDRPAALLSTRTPAHTPPMCGRFANQLPPEEIARLFNTVGDVPNLGPNWNVAPTQSAMVVRLHPETGERRLDVLRWGLVLHFTKDVTKAARPINARAETVASCGMFRGALTTRRRIVPADAFYEWKAMADGKQPYAIARTDGARLALAGLWEGWRAPDGETLCTLRRHLLACLATPSEHLLPADLPATCHLRHPRPWLQRLRNDACLLLGRPFAPTPRPRQQLNPPKSTLRAVINVEHSDSSKLSASGQISSFTHRVEVGPQSIYCGWLTFCTRETAAPSVPQRGAHRAEARRAQPCGSDRSDNGISLASRNGPAGDEPYKPEPLRGAGARTSRDMRSIQRLGNYSIQRDHPPEWRLTARPPGGAFNQRHGRQSVAAGLGPQLRQSVADAPGHR
jgi:hypothetical protein